MSNQRYSPEFKDEAVRQHPQGLRAGRLYKIYGVTSISKLGSISVEGSIRSLSSSS